MSKATECQHPVSELLPWSVNGTLDNAEQRSVEEHLLTCEPCRADRELLMELRNSVNDKTVAPIVPQGDVTKLFAKIDNEAQTPSATGTSARHGVVAGLIAASLVVAVFFWRGAVIDEAPVLFETATSGEGAIHIDYVLRISFEPDTTDSARDAIFSGLQGKDVSKEEGFDAYRVVVRVPGTSLEEVELYTGQIESRPEVSQVEVVAVQIPTRKAP